MDFKKAGRYLKKVREQRGLTHDHIYEATKIQPEILKQIEEGEVSLNDIFLKNFIKAYAQFLSVNLSLFNKNKPASNGKVEEKKSKAHKNKVLFLLAKYKKIYVLCFVLLICAIKLNSKIQKTFFKNPSPPSNPLQSKVYDPSTKTKKALFTQQLKAHVFQQEILIRPLAKKSTFYFKTDQKALKTKVLLFEQWYSIQASQYVYLRFNSQEPVEIFYNGKFFGSISGFFEKNFSRKRFLKKQ